MDLLEIEHNGYKATAERRSDSQDRLVWWLRLGSTEIPVGEKQTTPEEVVELARYYIGEPPPADHASIWGGYTCSDCGVRGVKLWREYQTFLDSQTLRCRACCEKHAGKPKSENSDQIGWSVPAVPTPDGTTFWGYSSVPILAVNWWDALPETNP